MTTTLSDFEHDGVLYSRSRSVTGQISVWPTHGTQPEHTRTIEIIPAHLNFLNKRQLRERIIALELQIDVFRLALKSVEHHPDNYEELSHLCATVAALQEL